MFQQNQKIKTFLTLAEELNYTKTAKLLFMSQQAVSRSVSSLENELNTQLFIRTTRSVELTHAGKQFYDLFSDLNKMFEERLAKIMQETKVEGTQLVRLGIHNLMDTAPVFEIVDYFSDEKSLIKLEISSAPPGRLIEQFERGIIDAMILIDRFMPNSKNARKRKIATYPLYLKISDKIPGATDDATYEDFMNMPFIADIMDGMDGVAHKTRLKHYLKLFGLSPEEIIWVEDRASAVTYAELGYGIIIDSNRSKVTATSHLKKYDTGTNESVWLVYNHENMNNIVANLLIKKLKDAFH